MNKKEYSEFLKLRLSSIKETHTGIALSIFTWLFLLNTGGLVGIMTLLSKGSNCPIKNFALILMALSFALGVVFTLLAICLDYCILINRYHRFDKYYRHWIKNRVINIKLIDEQTSLGCWTKVTLCFEILAIVYFLTGLFIGLSQLFYNNKIVGFYIGRLIDTIFK